MSEGKEERASSNKAVEAMAVSRLTQRDGGGWRWMERKVDGQDMNRGGLKETERKESFSFRIYVIICFIIQCNLFYFFKTLMSLKTG